MSGDCGATLGLNQRGKGWSDSSQHRCDLDHGHRGPHACTSTGTAWYLSWEQFMEGFNETNADLTAPGGNR